MLRSGARERAIRQVEGTRLLSLLVDSAAAVPDRVQTAAEIGELEEAAGRKWRAGGGWRRDKRRRAALARAAARARAAVRTRVQGWRFIEFMGQGGTPALGLSGADLERGGGRTLVVVRGAGWRRKRAARAFAAAEEAGPDRWGR